MIKVGIPAALAYYQYYPMWKTFFETLGAETVTSPPTTRTSIIEGARRVVPDTCLPVKAFMGHVLYLTDKCDYLFVPIIRSIKKRAYNCAKFLGLPDMVRAVIPNCPPVIDIEIDVNKGLPRLLEDIIKFSKIFTDNRQKILEAINQAWKVQEEYLKLIASNQFLPLEAFNVLFGEQGKTTQNILKSSTDKGITIAITGHHYLIYDEEINHHLLPRLQKAGCRVFTPEMLEPETLEKATAQVTGKAYWTWEEEVIGAGKYYIDQKVDGVIGISAFGCGPDSLMMELIRREALRTNRIPFLNIVLEEHTAETGVITRLEAFLDMIERRKWRRKCE